jgi:hypothetical protein
MMDVMLAQAEQAAVEAGLRRAAAHHGYDRRPRFRLRGRSRPTAARGPAGS